MLAYALRAGRLRAVVALACAASSLPLLPAGPSVRAQVTAAIMGLGAPLLVLGRDNRRRDEGFREALRVSRRGGRLVLAELLLPGLAVCAAALMFSGGAALPALVLAAWGLGCLTLADALDRRALHPGAAWIAVTSLVLALLGSPWLLAPLMGHGYGHWPATLGIGLHPAASALAASGRAALQDPFFYTWTLSGTVDARPLPWAWGPLFHLALAVIGTGWAVLSARRPVRSWT